MNFPDDEDFVNNEHRFWYACFSLMASALLFAGGYWMIKAGLATEAWYFAAVWYFVALYLDVLGLIEFSDGLRQLAAVVRNR